MINALVNRPNHVRERQIMVQSSNKPVYLRLPRSRLYFVLEQACVSAPPSLPSLLRYVKRSSVTVVHYLTHLLYHQVPTLRSLASGCLALAVVSTVSSGARAPPKMAMLVLGMESYVYLPWPN
ncbi:unnamed protein product [Rhizoctonia solani]|uniref:Uncharacterized protein n=1 Tax=Rhizoctonia solani TaxID=456999 RepID=A0A8H3H969_9AGAM|nr:unnamed protein product [Rhizoctonia solani]